MKAKFVIGIIIALVMVISFAVPVTAAAPTPFYSEGIIYYTTPAGPSFRIQAPEVCWQNAHPTQIIMEFTGTRTDGINEPVDLFTSAPKGADAKYPQNLNVDNYIRSDFFGAGTIFYVKVIFADRKGVALYSSTPYQFTWGTAGD
jgi:hypothetical protein